MISLWAHGATVICLLILQFVTMHFYRRRIADLECALVTKRALLGVATYGPHYLCAGDTLTVTAPVDVAITANSTVKVEVRY